MPVDYPSLSRNVKCLWQLQHNIWKILFETVFNSNVEINYLDFMKTKPEKTGKHRLQILKRENVNSSITAMCTFLFITCVNCKLEIYIFKTDLTKLIILYMPRRVRSHSIHLLFTGVYFAHLGFPECPCSLNCEVIPGFV